MVAWGENEEGARGGEVGQGTSLETCGYDGFEKDVEWSKGGSGWGWPGLAVAGLDLPWLGDGAGQGGNKQENTERERESSRAWNKEGDTSRASLF